ncbi:hypothetical protein [Cryobacterium sp. GrIS_2_6]|uniref:hypothetical protein n=1 Tax=Cryobacterium sp. GrIS_2_6 TaxID=3162785 RepID=UPI002DF8F710|nr:hypothetical protein [Cryobacterium psychrotolerans]
MRKLSVTRHPGKGRVAPPIVGAALLVILAVGLPLAAIQVAGAIRQDPAASAPSGIPAASQTAVPTPVPTAPAQPSRAQPSPAIRALDSDNPISDPAWFVRAYEAGFRLYILSSTEFGTCTPLARTQAQLAMAIDAGLAIAAYTRDPRCWQEGIAATGSFRIRLQFFALDIETGGPPLTRDMITGVQSTGVRPVVYTGARMWDDIMGAGTTEFSDVALWDAVPVQPGSTALAGLPDDPVDLLSPPPIPFGGWNASGNLRVGVQQHFERVFNGVNIDVNTFARSFLY